MYQTFYIFYPEAGRAQRLPVWIADRWPLMERPHFHSNLKRLESAFLWKYCSSSICTSFFRVLGHMSINLNPQMILQKQCLLLARKVNLFINDGELFWRILLLCKLSDEKEGGSNLGEGAEIGLLITGCYFSPLLIFASTWASMWNSFTTWYFITEASHWLQCCTLMCFSLNSHIYYKDQNTPPKISYIFGLKQVSWKDLTKI